MLPQLSLMLTLVFHPTSLSIKQLLLGDPAALPGCARTESKAGTQVVTALLGASVSPGEFCRQC